MRTHEVAHLLTVAAQEADAATAGRPRIEPERVIVEARARRRRRYVLATRAAVAAAVLVVAVGSMVFLTGRPPIEAPPPEHLVLLVDSLYPRTDYMVDEISRYLTPARGDDFLDQVWGDVLAPPQD